MAVNISLLENNNYSLTVSEELTVRELILLRDCLDSVIKESQFWLTNWDSFTGLYLNQSVIVDTINGVSYIQFDYSVLLGNIKKIIYNPTPPPLFSGLESTMVETANQLKLAWEHPSNNANIYGFGSLDFIATGADPNSTLANPLPDISLPYVKISRTGTNPSDVDVLNAWIQWSYYYFIKPVLSLVNQTYKLNKIIP